MAIEGPPCTPFMPAQCPLCAPPCPPKASTHAPMRAVRLLASPGARKYRTRPAARAGSAHAHAARPGAAHAPAARAGAAHAHQPCVRAQVPPAQVSHACAPAYAYYVIPSIVVFSHARLMPTMFAPHAHHGTVPWWASAGTWKPSIEFIHILPCPPKAHHGTVPWWASAGTWKPSIEFIHILPCPPKATRPTLAKPS